MLYIRMLTESNISGHSECLESNEENVAQLYSYKKILGSILKCSWFEA